MLGPSDRCRFRTAGCTADVTAAALATRVAWFVKKEAASAVLVTSISDDELHVIDGIEDEPAHVWARLAEKFDRKSEAKAETCLMSLLDFTHQESQTAEDIIERFETILKLCLDQKVTMAADVSMQQRMLILHPLSRYRVLKQNYMLADAAAKPDLETLKCQLRDIDLELVSPGGAKSKAGQGHRAEDTKANWGQKSGDKRDKNSGRGGGSGGRGRGRRGNDDRGNNDREKGDKGASSRGDGINCYCCGKKGHIKPECQKRNEECRQCGRVGHLQATSVS